MSDPIFPATSAALDAAWLTGALHGDGSLPADSRVAGLRLGPVDLGGVNGDVYRVLPRYQGAPGPLTLIAKFPSSAAPARGVATFQRWYEREVRAYRELNGPDGAAGALPMPRAHFAALDGDGGFLLVLEDLGVRTQGDQLAGCSADDALAAVRAIAGVHARWWDAPALSDALSWLPLTTVGLDHAPAIQGAFARAWSVVGASVEAPRGFAARVPTLIQRYPDLLAEAARPPLTVVHGDYRLDNLFFEGAGKDRRVRAIDWQFTCRCRGMYDVAYFTALDLQPDARREVEPRAVTAYLAALAAHGVTGYDAEQARRDYALGLLLAFATFVIGAAGEQANERMRAVHQVGLHRLAVAIVENEALD